MRGEILDATRQILESHGVDGLTLDRVANELGLTKAALYYYFKGRDALLFELMIELLLAEAHAIHDAVQATETGADALEAQIRTMMGHYEDRLADFRLVYASVPSSSTPPEPTAEILEKIRPLNDLVYGSVEKRLVEDQARGALPDDVDPRRLAFLSHVSALGILTMRNVVEPGDPLIHGTEELTEDLVRVFRKAATRDE